MGNAGSAHAQASLRVVAAVSGTAPVPLDAAEWQQLLSYATPLSRFDPGEVEREIRPHCAELGAWGWQLRHGGTGGSGMNPAGVTCLNTTHVACPPVAYIPLLPAPAVYNNSQTLNLQRFIVLVAQQLRKARRQVGAAWASSCQPAAGCGQQTFQLC